MGRMEMAIITCFTCFTIAILPVRSTDKDNEGFDFTKYSEGVVQSVWHIPDLTLFVDDGIFFDTIVSSISGHAVESQAKSHTKTGEGLVIEVMNPSWGGAEESHVYQRGQPVYLQVTATPAAGNQLFVQSCHASLSPNPSARPRLGLIVNKGCVASRHSVVKFLSRRKDSVNLVLHTSSLSSSKIYVHCSVAISRQGVTTDTKSCNYNRIKSRWVELSGDLAVCECCGTKCRGSSHRALPIDQRMVVSTGPLLIMEWKPTTEPLPRVHQRDDPLVLHAASSMSSGDQSLQQSPWLALDPRAALAPEVGTSPKGWIASGASVSGSSAVWDSFNQVPWLSPPAVPEEGVMVMSQDQGGTLSLWLPGDLVQVQSAPFLAVGLLGSSPQEDAPGVLSMFLQGDAPVESLHPLHDPTATWHGKASLRLLPTDETWSQKLNSGVSEDYLASNRVENVALTRARPGMSSYLEDASLLEESQRKQRGGVSRSFKMDGPSKRRPPSNGLVPSLPVADEPVLRGGHPLDQVLQEDEVVVLRQTELVLRKAKGGQTDEPSLIHSKLRLSQAADGSSTLRYEEEHQAPNQGDRASRRGRLATEQRGVRKTGKKGRLEHRDMVSSLIDLLRRLDEAE